MTTGRNDIESVKVAMNGNGSGSSVYFWVRCVAPNVQPAGEGRLCLLIDADGRPDTGFGGFEVLVNRRPLDDVKVSIERIDSGGRPVNAGGGTVDCRIVGDALAIEIPLDRLNLPGGAPRFNFKWVDGLATTRPSVMDFYDKGDAAPNGRWAYRFDTTDRAWRQLAGRSSRRHSASRVQRCELWRVQ